MIKTRNCQIGFLLILFQLRIGSQDPHSQVPHARGRRQRRSSIHHGVLAYQSRYLRCGVGANDSYETELAFLLAGSCEPGSSNIAAMVRSMFDVVIFSRVQSCYRDPDPTQKTTTGWCFENPLP
jgi:hypothetical protein